MQDMRRHLVPYAAFVGSFILFAWLLRGAEEGAQYFAALVLALLVWWAVGRRTRA
jgi:hypothetical protein